MSFPIPFPVSGSKAPTPWKYSGFASAGAYPFPLDVTTWTSTGPSMFSRFWSVPMRASRSCPGIGPM